MSKKMTTEGVVGEHEHGGFELPGGKYLAVIIIAAIVLGTIGYFATQMPAKTSGGMMGDGKVQPAENPAVDAATATLVATPITNLIPVPANVQTTGLAIMVNNPPQILKIVSGGHQEVYLTNIVFTQDKFIADIENRWTGREAQGFKKILLVLDGMPGAARIVYTDDPKKALVIPAGQKFRFEVKFNNFLSEEQRSGITTAVLYVDNYG